MKNVLFIISIVCLLIGLQSCYKEELVFDAEIDERFNLPLLLSLNGKECAYDHQKARLRYSIEDVQMEEFSPFIEFQEYSSISFEGKLLKNGVVNHLGFIALNKDYKIKVSCHGESKDLVLSFTNLPIVQLISPNEVFDEPKTIAKIILNYPEISRKTEKYIIGIEHRGGSSQAYQKKSYGISLKGSISLDDDISRSLFQMKENNDWILDAMWIDPARLRNKTSFELWSQLGGNKKEGIASEFVELFLNNEHRGLYCFNENMNAEHLDLHYSTDVLYKSTAWENGAAQFETDNSHPPLSYYWDGWEQKYPDPKIKLYWQPLDDLRNLIVHGDDDVFRSQINSMIHMDNFMDYYIFLNLLSATDNSGKNTFLAKENKENKFYLIPWDLDGAWGLYWNGDYIGHTSVLSNHLYDRLLETNTHGFKEGLKQRWIYLRSNTLSEENIKELFTQHFTTLKASDIMALENKKWGSKIDMNMEQEYLIQWLEYRLVFLDEYFKNL